MDSILTSVKKQLGIMEDYEHFDDDIIMHINAVLMILNQLGVGQTEGFLIEDKTTTWSDYVSEEWLNRLGAIKTYVGLKVRLIFDPPTSSSHLEAMKQTISELEWRLNIEVDNT